MGEGDLHRTSSPSDGNRSRTGRAYIRQFAAENPRSEEWAKTWLDQMEKSIEKLDGKPCEEAIEKMNDPFPSITIVAALLTMTWRIVETTGPQMFLTSDNPAVYIRYEGYGLGGKEARDRHAHLTALRAARIAERLPPEFQLTSRPTRRLCVKSTSGSSVRRLASCSLTIGHHGWRRSWRGTIWAS